MFLKVGRIGPYTGVLDSLLCLCQACGFFTLASTFLDKPTVSLRMYPPSPVSELDRANVSLFCDVSAGNPPELVSVKWLMDGVLLKQLPLCDNDGQGEEDLCDVDPSKLLLEHVTRSFHGNYSCQGTNGAGWSEPSDEEELEIFCESNRIYGVVLRNINRYKYIPGAQSLACRGKCGVAALFELHAQ